MKMMKLCLISFWCIFLLSACYQPDETVIRFGLSTMPITLDPRFATDAVSVRINRLLYRGLTDFNENAEPIPDLAHWQQIDNTHYLFILDNQGRHFHNGNPLTAYDVKATYDFVLDENNASPHRSGLEMIQSIEVLDDNRIEFTLNKIDPLFVGRLGIGIVPEHIADNTSLSKYPIGSGNFKLLDWSTPSRLVIERIKDKQPVEFLEVKDATVRVLKLLRHELDIVQNELSPELINWLNQRPEVKISKKHGSNFSYIGFQLQDPVTSQLVIRQAIAYALNREEIIHYVMGNSAQLANTLFPPTHWVGNPNLPYYAYQPDKARLLIQQSDLPQPVHITYKTSNNPFRIRLATIIQQQLKEVGIEVDLRTYDWGTFYGDIKAGNFQMYTLSWVGIKMPDIFHYAFHSTSVPPTGANRGRLNDPAVDKLIEQAEDGSTLPQQQALYRQLQTYLFEQLPYVPLWYEDNVLVTSQRIEGYQLAVDGNYDGLNTVTIHSHQVAK